MLGTDNGTAQILSAFRARLDTGRRGGDPHGRPPPLGMGDAPQPDPDGSLAAADGEHSPGLKIMQEFAVQLGRVSRRLDRMDDLDQVMAQAVSVIPIPPQNYTVVSGTAKFKADKASGADSGPQEGYFWFVTRLTLAGLGNGDMITMHKVQSSTNTNLSTALHTFGPGLGAPVAVTNPPVPATTVAQANYFGQDMAVTVTGGTVTSISVGGNVTGLTSGTVVVPSGSSITLAYTAAPTWSWAPAGSRLYKTVDDWEPGVYGLPMWPDDSLYPVAVSPALASTELLLTGNAIQVEARLLWKFIL